MPDTLRIALAEPSQVDAISALIRSLASYFVATPDDEQVGPFLYSLHPSSIASLIADPAYRYYTATSGDTLRGVIALRDRAHVHHLFVAPDDHRRGIARALWEHAQAEARRPGERGAFTVNSSLHAVPVYERFGFCITGPETERNGVRFVPMRRD